MTTDFLLVLTDGQDPRFATLCRELDQTLNTLVGGETQRKQYIQYNTLETIHNVVLVLKNGQPVACGGYKQHAPGTAEVKRVYVRPDCRGQGYAKAILAALESRAASQGYTRLILETGSMLHAAIALYTAIGFERIQNYPPYHTMPMSVCMEKRLGSSRK